MQINTQLIKNSFEKSMEKYNENAIIQKDLAEKLVNHIADFSFEFDTIFEIGCGTGILTRNIQEKFKFKKYYANDLVEKSKNYINKILPEFVFIHGNAQKITPPGNIDLLVSNAVFQWFYNLDNFINYYKPYLNKNCILGFTTFGKENFAEINDITGLSLNYLSKEQIEDILKPSFEVLYSFEYKDKLNFNSPLEILAHMKNTGVNSLKTKNWSVKDIKAFCENYLNKYNSLTLTYNPIIIIAKFK